jgi:hypothetical protein
MDLKLSTTWERKVFGERSYLNQVYKYFWLFGIGHCLELGFYMSQSSVQ